MNTPECIAVLWDLLKDDTVSDGDKKTTILTFDSVLGVGFSEPARHKEIVKITVVSEKDIPEEIQRLVDEREQARELKDFEKADTARSTLEQKGYTLEDTPAGVVVKKKPTT